MVWEEAHTVDTETTELQMERERQRESESEAGRQGEKAGVATYRLEAGKNGRGAAAERRAEKRKCLKIRLSHWFKMSNSKETEKGSGFCSLATLTYTA